MRSKPALKYGAQLIPPYSVNFCWIVYETTGLQNNWLILWNPLWQDQDPYSMGPLVIEAARTSLRMRYSLLPYLYTLFYRSHVFGETVARPLFFEYVLLSFPCIKSFQTRTAPRWKNRICLKKSPMGLTPAMTSGAWLLLLISNGNKSKAKLSSLRM